MSRFRALTKVSLLLILLGSILRLAFFWQPSFTGDESGHMMKAISVARGLSDFVLGRNRQVALQNIFKPILEHNHPPLEFLVLIPSVPFYPREFFARLIYVLIAIATMVGGFLVVYRYRGKMVAIIFLALLGTSSYLVWFSQMVTFGLNLTAGILLGLGLLAFVSIPNVKSLVFLVLSSVFSLYVSVDFLLYIPVIGYAILMKRRHFQPFALLKIIGAGVFLLAVFYVPYVGYSFLPDSPTGAGFIHYKSYVTAQRATQVGSFFNQGLVTFLQNKWELFFGRPGVWTVWPWALLSFIRILRKQETYQRYLWFALLLVVILEIPLIPCCTVFLNLFGPLLLLAAEGMALFPKFAYPFIISVTLIHLFQAQPIFKGTPNPVTFRNWNASTDRIREVSQLIKPCLTDEQTYISTEDAWRARYYFGKPMLATVEYEVINEETATEQFLRGDLPQIELIHIHTDQVSENLQKQLKYRARNYQEVGPNRIFYFTACP